MNISGLFMFYISTNLEKPRNTICIGTNTLIFSSCPQISILRHHLLMSSTGSVLPMTKYTSRYLAHTPESPEVLQCQTDLIKFPQSHFFELLLVWHPLCDDCNSSTSYIYPRSLVEEKELKNVLHV